MEIRTTARRKGQTQKHMKKIRVLLFGMLTAALFTACGATEKDKDKEEAAVPTPQEEEEEFAGVQADPRGEPFAGLWSCEAFGMRIEAEDEGYKVSVDYRQDDANEYRWYYACMYEEASASLTDPGYGYKTALKYDEKGELLSEETVAEKLGARFTLDDDGFLHWNNYEEEIGKDLKFEKISAAAYYMWDTTDEATLRTVFPEELFSLPENAQLVEYRILKNNYPEQDLSPLVEMVFDLDGREYVARMQQGYDVEWDISGVYSFRAVKEEVSLSGWGGARGECFNTVDDESAFMLLIWQDEATKTSYSLYYCNTEGGLDGVDLVELANGMVPKAND